jgi:hypothetical protein
MERVDDHTGQEVAGTLSDGKGLRAADSSLGRGQNAATHAPLCPTILRTVFQHQYFSFLSSWTSYFSPIPPKGGDQPKTGGKWWADINR